MKKDIAVLITCHNRKDKTLTCLEALYKCDIPTGYTINIFLTDDGCTDGTADAVCTKYPQVHIVTGDGTLFWNRGMHLAWKTARQHADYDYYLWLNDDTELKSDCIQKLLCGTNHQIIVGTTSNKSTGEITYGGFDKRNRHIIPGNDPINCEYFNGNIVLIPIEIVTTIGLNDPIFRHALGDFDYGMRARKARFELLVAPGILGYCDEHTAAPKWRNPSVSLYKRIIELYKPLGNDPFEFFVFDFRHNGLINAIIHFFSIHLRTLFPNLWNK